MIKKKKKKNSLFIFNLKSIFDFFRATASFVAGFDTTYCASRGRREKKIQTIIVARHSVNAIVYFRPFNNEPFNLSDITTWWAHYIIQELFHAQNVTLRMLPAVKNKRYTLTMRHLKKKKSYIIITIVGI